MKRHGQESSDRYSPAVTTDYAGSEPRHVDGAPQAIPGAPRRNTIAASDGTLLGHTHWPAVEQELCGAALLLHGLGDHCEMRPYSNAAVALSGAGIAVHAMDLRGHGRSQGDRMNLRRWDSYLDDVASLRETLTPAERSVPLLLVGVSLGGLIALDVALQRGTDLAGVAVAAPALASSGSSAALRVLLPLMLRIMPDARLSPRLNLESISRDRNEAELYTRDPLRERKMTPRMGNEILQAIAGVHQRADKLQVPLLILHGTDDRIIDAASSEEFFRNVRSSEKQRKVYHGARHQLFIETIRVEALEDLVSWCQRQASAAAAAG